MLSKCRTLSCPPHEEEHSGPKPLVTLEAFIKPQSRLSIVAFFCKLFPRPGPKEAKKTHHAHPLGWESSACAETGAETPGTGVGGRGWWEALGQAGAGLSGERSPEEPVSCPRRRREKQEAAQTHP